MMMMLAPNPNLKGYAKAIAESTYDLARSLTNSLDDSPELVAGLRKLLEAKDCFVRAHIWGGSEYPKDK